MIIPDELNRSYLRIFHEAGYIHTDLSENMSHTSHPGMSKKYNKNDLEGGIYLYASEFYQIKSLQKPDITKTDSPIFELQYLERRKLQMAKSTPTKTPK